MAEFSPATLGAEFHVSRSRGFGEAVISQSMNQWYLALVYRMALL